MKTKKLFHVASVLAMGLTLASCGSDNKSNGVSSNGFGNFNVGNNGQSVSSNTCQGGQATSFSFSLSGPNTNAFYLAQMQPGQQVSGGSTNVYYGRDVGTGDQIAVQKITSSNGQYAQYNVQMSICALPNGIPLQVQQPLGQGCSNGHCGQSFIQLGGHTGSGVNATIFFQASANSMGSGTLYSIFSPAQ